MNGPVPVSLPTFTEPSEYSRYLLTTPADVRAVLRQLKERHSQITVFFDEGQSFLLTTVLQLRDAHLVLDYGAQAEMNRKALAAAKHFCVTQCEGVRVQFLLGAFSLIDFEGAPAFLAELPKEVLRLQRREYYRLATPISPPVRCVLPLRLPEGGVYYHESRVYDISSGGLCIDAPPEGVPFEIGAKFSDCRVDLPEFGALLTTLTVCNLREIETPRGGKQRRAGCAFDKLPAAEEARIQRYILAVERSRKARGLA
ncbi:MAG: flagellar brake protein [Rhodocyclaceae bacterium]|nr:flagellar brake protein [Rhodocyclaceae bacterium]